MTTDSPTLDLNRHESRITHYMIYPKGPLALRHVLAHTMFVPDPTISGMRNDGMRIIYNPTYVEQLAYEEFEEEAFRHSLHIAFQHAARRGDRDLARWNEAAQHVVEADLDRLSHPTIVRPGSQHRPYRGKTIEEIYDLLDQEDAQRLDEPVEDLLPVVPEGTSAYWARVKAFLLEHYPHDMEYGQGLAKRMPDASTDPFPEPATYDDLPDLRAIYQGEVDGLSLPERLDAQFVLATLLGEQWSTTKEALVALRWLVVHAEAPASMLQTFITAVVPQVQRRGEYIAFTRGVKNDSVLRDRIARLQTGS